MSSAAPDAAERGTAGDALRVPAFRRLFIGSSLSNTGRWLQTAALGVLGWKISESPAYLGAIIFAQLAPLGLLSLIGGSLADTTNRQRLLLGTQTWQMVWTFVLAALVTDGDIGRTTLLVVVFIIGLGQGLYAPALTSVLPSIAGERNLSAAIALNSMQVNGSRVIGPAIGGFLVSQFDFAFVFQVVGASYIFVLFAIARTPIPDSTASSRSLRDRLFGGFTIANRAPQVGRPLLLMFLFSFLCLPFIGQLPAIAEINLEIDTESTTYGWFYASFGFGALLGATAVGTVFLRTPSSIVARFALLGFAASLAWLAFTRVPVVAFGAIFAVGLFYFALPTALATHWQEHVHADVRGRVAALWVLCFGGTLPIANIVAGQIAEATSLMVVLLTGAFAAVALSALPLTDGPVVGEEILND